MLRTEKSVFFDDFLRTRGLLYWMYCARTVAENGEKDAFSVICDNEWNPYPFLFAFRWGYRRISQRICQRHGKIARKHFIYKDRVRLDNEFGSFFISRHYFSLKDLWSLTYSTVTKFSFLMFRLMPSCPCRKAENKKGVTKK